VTTPPMNPPPPPGQMPPAAAPMGRDRTELWGWLGIVIGLLCCGLLGVVFGVLSIQDARRFGKSPILGWIAIGAGALNILTSAILTASGNYPGLNR
jgi:predicted lipid-binding transport protein (Tim44 family)